MNIMSVKQPVTRIPFKGQITDDALKYAFNKSYDWNDKGPSITSFCNNHIGLIIDGVKDNLSPNTVVDICYDADLSGKLNPRLHVYNKALQESVVSDFDLYDLYPSEIKKFDIALLRQFRINLIDKLVKTGNVNEISKRLSHATQDYGDSVPTDLKAVSQYLSRYKKAISQLDKFKKDELIIDNDNLSLRNAYEKWQKSGAVLDKKI